MDFQYWKQTYSYQRENMGVKDKSGDRDEHKHTITIYKIDNQQWPTV